MHCPLCSKTSTPGRDGGQSIVYYSCPQCGTVWSARIGDGQPTGILLHRVGRAVHPINS